MKPIFTHSLTRFSAKLTLRTSPVSPTSPKRAVKRSTGFMRSALARAAHHAAVARLAGGDGGARRLAARFGEEEGGIVAHAQHAAIAHLEDAHFLHGAEAVLDGAEDLEVLGALALEIEDGIHDVFEHFGPRERAFFGDVPDEDVPDEEEGDPARLCDAHELCGAFAHLPDAARRRTQRLGVDRLDGVDDDVFRLADRLFRVVEAGLVQKQHPAAAHAEALAAELDLRTALLGGKVEDFVLLCKVRRDLCEEGRFSHAGIAADEHEGASYDAAAEDDVELGDARRDALIPLVLHFAKGGGAGGVEAKGALRFFCGRGGDGFFDEGIELPSRTRGSAPATWARRTRTRCIQIVSSFSA